MAFTNKTPNYNLPQYIATDKPTYLVDYNNAMLEIDTALHENKTSSDTALDTANAASSKADQAIGTANNATTAAGEAKVIADSAVTIANNASVIAGDAQVDAHASLTKIVALEPVVAGIEAFTQHKFTFNSQAGDRGSYTALFVNTNKSIANFKGFISFTDPSKLPAASTVIATMPTGYFICGQLADPGNMLNLREDVAFRLGDFTALFVRKTDPNNDVQFRPIDIVWHSGILYIMLYAVSDYEGATWENISICTYVLNTPFMNSDTPIEVPASYLVNIMSVKPSNVNSFANSILSK